MDKYTNKININKFQKNIFWSLFLFNILFFGLYIFFVNQTILNIVAREDTESSISDLNSKISEAEFKYIALKNSVTIDYAYSAGFKDVKNVKFASRKISAKSLSLNIE